MGVVYFILRAPGRAPRYRATLDALTEHTRTARECKTMGRLADKFKRANDAIAGFEVAAERDIDAVIERVSELHQKREQVKLQKHLVLDQHMGDLAEFARDLDEELRGNGAPPDGSEGGEKPGPVGTEPGKLASNAWDSGNAYLATGDDVKTG
jgi:hypothetical protein